MRENCFKRKLILGMSIILSGVFASCALGAVSQGYESSKASSSLYSKESSAFDLSSSEEISSSEETQEKTPVLEEEVDKLLTALENHNYTFKTQKDGRQVSYIVDDNKLKVEGSEDDAIYRSFNNNMYKFVYRSEEGIWKRYIFDGFKDYENVIYNHLAGAIWNDFNPSTNVATGVSIDKNISIDFDDYTVSGDISGQICDVGTSTVKMPESNQVVVFNGPESEDVNQGGNNNQNGNENGNQGNENTTSNKTVCKIENGKYVFDSVAIRETFLEWLKNDNQYGKDVNAAIFDKEYFTDDVIYIKAEKDHIECGYICHNADGKYFRSSEVRNDQFYSDLSSGKIKTQEDLLKAFKTLGKYDFFPTRNFVKIDTEISQSNFNTLTKNAFERLENKGTQGTSINNDYPETKLENFSKAKVLYGFKTQAGSGSAGGNLGFTKGWDQYYIIDYKNNIEFVKCVVVSSTSNNVENELENVLNNNSRWWMVGAIEREDINADNAKIYENTAEKTL